MRKLFSIDCHCATTTDIQWMASQWGDLQVDEWNIGHHAHLVGKTRFCPPMFENENWKNLSPKMVDDFYHEYKDTFKDYDGFLVNYPFPFCLLWEKFEKPIYANICIRYEFPFSWDTPRWSWLDERSGIMRESGQLRLNANNYFDADYLNAHNFTLKVDSVIPNLCAYTGASYTGKKNHFWVHSKIDFKGKYKIGSPFPKNHSWQDIADGLGVFFIPYNVSVMSFYEWYASGIPIIVPSRKWVTDLGMSEIYFNPNLARHSRRGEVELSDFYSGDFPNILYVDSAQDFMQNIRQPLLAHTSEAMKFAEPARREKIMSAWRKFLFTF